MRPSSTPGTLPPWRTGGLLPGVSSSTGLLARAAPRWWYAVLSGDYAYMRRAEWGQLHDLCRGHACTQRLDYGVDENLPGLFESLLSLAVLLSRPAERLAWIIHRYTVAPLTND